MPEAVGTVKMVGANGQISLGKQFAGRQVLVEEQGPGVWLIRTATVVPDSERWLLNTEALADLKKALKWAKENPPNDSNVDELLARLNDESELRVQRDLNNPAFPENLLTMEKPDRHSALETLTKLRRMTWNQVYRDGGLKWEKIAGVKPPVGVAAIYSLRITQSRRATAYRDGEFMRFLTVAPDHDATYGKK